MTQETKICQNCKQSFVIEPEDFNFYERISAKGGSASGGKVPPPTFCWLCRAQRRFAFRNERKLYRRISDFTGKEIFSQFPQESPVRVYEKEIWDGDQWDPMEYGRGIDFSRPFLNQLYELFKEVPQPSKGTLLGVNSDYSNNFTGYKNCYLVFNGRNAEDCIYGNGVSSSKFCVDISHVINSELCYECFWLTSCSRLIFCSHCENSYDMFFSKNCIGCHDCFGCINLRNQSYQIFNAPYSKEDYFKRLKNWDLGSYLTLEAVKRQTHEFWLKFPNKFIEGLRNTNVSGNYIYSSKNVLNSYLIREGENLHYCQYLQDKPNKDCYDHTVWGDGNELSYECAVCGEGAHNIRFCMESWSRVSNLEYCGRCRSSSNLFGCGGLKNKQYCILNKQYSKEEYFTLRGKIIEYMNKMPYKDKTGRIYKYGEFFPIEFSPFNYNETIAIEHFPLSKEEIIAQGYNWGETPRREYQTTMKAADLPDHIKDVQDSITDEIIQCTECQKAYRILQQELAFYRNRGLPIPRKCIDCRHRERISQRNSIRLWHRKCQCAGQKSENGVYQNTVAHFHKEDHCPNEFETSYASERKEIVYCEQCYNNEVV